MTKMGLLHYYSTPHAMPSRLSVIRLRGAIFLVTESFSDQSSCFGRGAQLSMPLSHPIAPRNAPPDPISAVRFRPRLSQKRSCRTRNETEAKWKG